MAWVDATTCGKDQGILASEPSHEVDDKYAGTPVPPQPKQDRDRHNLSVQSPMLELQSLHQHGSE